MKTAAFILVAGGSGTRMGASGWGETPKQLLSLNGKTLLDWSLEAARASALFQTLVVVWPPAAKRGPDWQAWLEASPTSDLLFAQGGTTRTDSVRAGLAALSSTPTDYVFIHDAARPGLDRNTLEALFNALNTADCAAPMLPVVDALKRMDDDQAPQSVDRQPLRRIQTPQAFALPILQNALAQGGEFDDDITAVMAAGHARFAPVTGTERLRKLTHPEDYPILEAMLMVNARPPFRVGHGYDVHAFDTGNAVTLCGVSIPHTHTLAGHSDADVGWHALTDAILGALAQGDIGDHFPPSDPQWKGAASHIFLAHAANLATKAGYAIGNLDITLICEAPKIAPHRHAMREATARLLDVDISQISVKATTTEKLGFTGRSEGIAAQASVMLIQKSG